MNPQLFELYKKELQHAREMGGQFAEEFPKIAGRLGLETLECADPYVERLLEGFAFLTARVQLKLEHSQGRLARHLLDMVSPNYLAPTPSMLIAEFTPSLSEGSLEKGFEIPRGTRLRGQKAADERTECEFRTSHDIKLWPINITNMRMMGSRSAIDSSGIIAPKSVRSAMAIELKVANGLTFNMLPLNELSIHLCGADDAAAKLYEQFFARTLEIKLVSGKKEIRSPRQKPQLVRQGFEDSEALLPVDERGFQGYRLIQEYFAFPERFHFLKISELASLLSLCHSDTIELVFLFDNNDRNLADLYSTENFRLNCVPAVNLFPKSVDRINLSNNEHEYHLVPDRTRPMDFEIFSIDSAIGYGTNQSDSVEFHSFYHVSEERRTASAFFSQHREPRLLSSRQKIKGPRAASYIGSEVFISLVDSHEAPLRSDMRQLAVAANCTNRDLPLQMPIGKFNTDFNLDIGAPVDRIRCLSRPTVPKQSRAHYRDPWALVSNLSLNYLSIDGAQGDDQRSAGMLRQMLELYIDENRGADKRQLEGIVSVTTEPAVRNRSYRGRVEVARGLEICLTLDESAFEGTGTYLMGAVLERFFARYCSINSFTETRLQTIQRNEIARWPVRLGQRQLI